MRENDRAQLYRVAKKYYIEGKLQNEIAVEEGVSRSMISKLLTKAKERGIARIEVVMPRDESVDLLEEMCEEKLGLEKVYIVEAPDSFDSEEEQIKNLCFQASEIVPELISGSTVVGVGTGRTMYWLSDEITPSKQSSQITFIPLAGNSSPNNRYLQNSTMVSRFADRFMGGCFFLNHYISVKQVKADTGLSWDYDFKNIGDLEELWDSMDCALFSLSNASLDGEYFSTNYDDTELDELLYHNPDSGGELLSQVFFRDGKVLPITIEKDFAPPSFPLDRLHSIKKTVCMAVGCSKAPVILRAAKLHYFNTLITDIPTAQKILDRCEDALWA